MREVGDVTKTLVGGGSGGSVQHSPPTVRKGEMVSDLGAFGGLRAVKHLHVHMG